MELRSYRNTDEKVSLLGFGCMRFPTSGEQNKIDEKATAKMIDYAWKNGVNYYDTAWPYHGGESETVLGKILKKYPRESFKLATKMPSWSVNTLDQAKDLFHKQLEKCQVEYFDYYLLHSLTVKSAFNKMYIDMGVLDYLKEEKRAGRIRKLGFSFHGTPVFLKYLLENYDWDFVQLQINYLDWDIRSARKMYALMEKYDMPCVVMEPVRGGMLAKMNPESLKILKKAEPDRSAASWAVRYVASLPKVLTILSGMSDMEQIKDNVKTLKHFEPLNDDERKVLDKALAAYLKNRPIPCTACRYCMPCPFKVDIPRVFMVYNEVAGGNGLPDPGGPHDEAFKKKKQSFWWRYGDIPSNRRAHNCTHCGQCVKKCPQHIVIPEKMSEIAKLADAIK